MSTLPFEVGLLGCTEPAIRQGLQCGSLQRVVYEDCAPNGSAPKPVAPAHLQTFDNMHRALRPCVTAALQSSSHPTACHRFPSADL